MASERLKVLFWMPYHGRIPGGHQVQLVETSRALHALGVDTFDSHDPLVSINEFDVVHGFGLTPLDVLRCRESGRPVVLSPIFWGLDYTTSGPRSGRTPRVVLRDWAGRSRRGARHFVSSLRGRGPLTRLAFDEASADLEKIAAYSMADLLLVNAEGEGDNIRRDLGVVTPTRVVPNAVDTARFSPYFQHPREVNTVICVGRLEPHKNQLGLIKALKDVDDVKITIVGPDHPDHPRYREACRRAAGPNVTFLPNVQHDQLAELYAAHQVHALASWYETTGLVSLEAAAAGCAVVTTDRGHAREYFRDDAWYCDPSHPGSIRDAVVQAMQHGPSTALAQRVSSEFSWEETARQTLAGYRYVLERRDTEPRASS